MADYNKSVLYDYHIESGAKFSPAFTWNLVQYYSEGAIFEQQYAEKHAVIFDNSHLSKFRLTYDKSCENELDKNFYYPISSLTASSVSENAVSDKNGNFIAIKIMKMADNDLFIIGACESKKALDVIFKDLSVNKKLKNFAYYDLTYDLGGIYLFGPEAENVLSMQENKEISLFKDLDKCGIITINDFRYIAFATKINDNYVYQFFASEDGIEDLWVDLYNTDPIKPMGIVAATSLELEHKNIFYNNKDDKAIVICKLPSRRQVYEHTPVFAENEESKEIGKTLKSFYSNKYDTAMTYAEIEKIYAKSTNLYIKNENICIKAEIIRVFDLT